MNFDRAVFGAYDIRGAIPDQLTPNLAYLIGNSVAGYLKPTSIAVGRDGHSSSAAISEALTSGILDRGADVVDVGMVPSDGLLFTVGANNYDGGVMILASQEMQDTVRIRLYRRNAEPLFGRDVFDVIADDIANDRADTIGVRGTIVRTDISMAYAEHVLSFIDPTAIKPYSLIVDAGGITMDSMLTLVFGELPCTLIPLPAAANDRLTSLGRTVADNTADFGVAFSEDGECIYLLEGSGSIIGGDIIMALVAEYILNRTPNETIVCDIGSSRSVSKLIEDRGGTPVRSAAGHATIRSLMKKHNAVFGGERSGRLYFRDNWFSGSGLITLLICLERLSRDIRIPAEILKDINPFVRSDANVGPVIDPLQKLDELAAAFADGDADRMDGLAVWYPDWWFHVRPSHTEPILRLTVEANNKSLLEDKAKRLREMIRA